MTLAANSRQDFPFGRHSLVPGILSGAAHRQILLATPKVGKPPFRLLPRQEKVRAS
jgi:hypothetical protein